MCSNSARTVLDSAAFAEAEEHQREIYRLAGADPDVPLSPSELCARLPDVGQPDYSATMRAQAELVRIDSVWVPFVRRGTPAPKARFLVGHEIAHWFYRRIGYRGLDLEARCDALGAALVVPRPVMLQVLERVGDDVTKLAAKLKTTQSLALLRRSEVTERPGAIVRAAGPIVRGAPCTWPVPLELRRVERARHPDLRKIPIRDEPLRVGVVAA